MFPSIIYSSPQGSGKTANSAELLQRFSLTDLIDDWKGQEIPSVGTLALTHLSPSQACHMAYRRNQHITLVTEGWKTAEWFRKLGVPNTTLSNSQLRDAIRETVQALHPSPFGGALTAESRFALQAHLDALLAHEDGRAKLSEI